MYIQSSNANAIDVEQMDAVPICVDRKQASEKSSICSEGVIPHEDTANQSDDHIYHIFIVGPDRMHDVITFAEDAFRVAGLNIFTHTTNNLSDVPNGAQTGQYVKQVLGRCLSVVIHPEVNDEDEDEVDNELCRLVDETIQTVPHHSLCLIRDRKLIDIPLKHLPSVHMAQYLDQQTSVRQPSFVKAQFIEQVMKCIFC